MKKLMLIFVMSVSALVLLAGNLSAKASKDCPMCTVSGGQPVVCVKCHPGKGHHSASKGTDLKCCCAKCDASEGTTAECRKACGLPIKK